MPEKFLKQVADYYIDSDIDMSGLTMVFPNRRSALFMRKYLRTKAAGTTFMPRMISITYFSQMFCPAALADNTELSFILYKVYCRILRRHGRETQTPDFDTFYFWSSVLLNDFNDIDAYMVDTSQIFRNLAGINEIEANYLTPEQIEVAKFLWGENVVLDDRTNFWKHVHPGDDNGPATDDFLSLWQIMEELHKEFIAELDSRRVPLSYSGLQSRRVANTISDMSADDFGNRRFAFIGFNVLPTSRLMIFKRLKQLGIAEFFWDVASPVLNPTEGTPHPAATTILSLARQFPMPDGFDTQHNLEFPDIEVIGVPSNAGQTKTAANILDSWHSQWVQELDNGSNTDKDKAARMEEKLIDTAVVLADESLLIPMLFSIPDGISTVNVTMGIPFNLTAFSALISSIFSMHRLATVTHGKTLYFYRHVIEVLSHPHMSLIAPTDSVKIKEKIFSEHIYNVDSSMLVAEFPDMAFIFAPLTDEADIRAVRKFITELVTNLSSRLKSHVAGNYNTAYYEMRILDAFAKALDRLTELTERYDISMQQHTMLQMLHNALGSQKINFSGEPLKGLQIMSLDQTRVLDFDNLIIVSANEKIFPAKNHTPSLIPNTLRAAYMLPTRQQEEASHAYHFFRLISRASRVRLLYDSRTSGLSSGEMSRYAAQLLHLYKDKGIKRRNIEYRADAKDPDPIAIHKTPEVIAELQAFKPGGNKRISASALKTYIDCPLRFYLEYVKGIRINDETMEYIDAATYGTALHKIAENLYAAYKGQTINEYTIDKMLADNLERRALEALNEIYYKHRYDNNLDMMPSEGRIIARVIVKYIRMMLQHEKKNTPFTFIAAEMGAGETFPWRVNDRHTINFTMSIDRVDAVGNPDDTENFTYRFIDYKTGSDEVKASSVDQLFSDHKFGGILQLLIYCYAFADRYNYHGRITPIIYKIKEIVNGINPITFSKEFIEDFHMMDETDFHERLEQLIDSIFEENDEKPFTQTTKTDNCVYCKFASMCDRYVEKSF